MRALVLGLLVCGLTACAQQVPAVGCTLKKDSHYLCNREVFQRRLAEAKTIRVDAGRMDLFAADRTRQLVEKLGKQASAPEAKADLVFEVDAVDRSGRINYGPGEIPVAMLKVIDPAMLAGGKTLWVETLDANSEWPWSADVVELLKQFQRHVVEK